MVSKEYSNVAKHHIPTLQSIARGLHQRSDVNPPPMLVSYFLVPEEICSPELGAYKTYGIAAYCYMSSLPTHLIRDISTDGDKIFCVARNLNKHQLSPLHLQDYILDILE